MKWKNIFPIVGLVVSFVATISKYEIIFGYTSKVNAFVRMYFTILLSFGMEYVAMYEHKYLWHSKYLWFIHSTHHHQKSSFLSGPSRNDSERNSFILPSEQKMELNDIFPAMFSSIAMIILWKCSEPMHMFHDICFGSACGISIYGTSYFIGHDLCSHERCGVGLAKWLKQMFPKMAECADVHSTYHHRIKKEISDDQDPYGAPYGFWLGPLEVKAQEENGEDLCMPIFMKCLFYLGAIITFASLVESSFKNNSKTRV